MRRLNAVPASYYFIYSFIHSFSSLFGFLSFLYLKILAKKDMDFYGILINGTLVPKAH